MNSLYKKMKRLVRALCIKRIRIVRWWHRQDKRYGLWWRLGNGLAAVLILVGVAIPVLQQLASSSRYKLSADALKLVGRTDPTLAQQLTYDASTQTYQFNKDAVNSTNSNPLEQLKSQVGTASGSSKDKSLYALDVPADPSKGVTYHDINSQLSFSLVPQFTAQSAQTEQGHIVFPLDGGAQAIYTLKNNGLKEDIVVQKATSNTMTYSYKLDLPKTLEARVIPGSDGAIGVYSADPALFGNISYGSNKDQATVEKVRENSAKTHLVFGLPSPVVKTPDGKQIASARFALNGNQLSVIAEGLSDIKTPFTIDPSVVVTSTSDFQTGGSDDGNINFSVSGQISRASLSAGTASGGWSATTSFTTAAYNISTVAYNGYLYVLGGRASSGSVNTVQYAQLTSGGTIAADSGCGTAWCSTNAFSSIRFLFAAVASNGYMYIMGGQNGSTFYNDTQYAPITSSGALGAWAPTTNLPQKTVGLAAAAYNGYVYIVGGCASTGATVCSALIKDVEYAPINANGTIGSWTPTGQLSTARDNLGAAEYNGYLYALGGCSVRSNVSGACTTSTASVEYAAINSNGTIGSWGSASALPTARNNFAATVSGGYVYIMGGDGITNDTRYAPIYANGTLGTWASTASFTTGRFGLGGAAYNGYVYIAGGCKSNILNCGSNILADVQYAKVDLAAGTQAFSGEGVPGSWSSTTSFIGIRYSHSSVAYNGYLYILGGYNGSTMLNDVQYAKLNSDGTVGTWHYTHDFTDDGTTFVAGFTTGRSGFGSAAYNGYLYILGGTNGTYFNDVQYAKLNSDGTVGTWTAAPSFTNIRALTAAVAYNGYLYILGGTDGTNYYNDVQYAPIRSNGSLGSWAATASFIAGRSGLTAAVYNGYLYIMGGFTGSILSNDVQYAPLNADGTAGAWHFTHNSGDDGTTFSAGFTTARYLQTSFAYNGYLYILGGSTGTYLNDVQYALINSNGTIGAWSTAPSSFTTGRGYAAAAAYNGYLYITGGASASNAYNDVQYSPLSALARVGHYSKLIDLGSAYNFTSVLANGSLPSSSANITYKAAGTSGVFSSTASQAVDTGAGGCYGSAQNVRYLLISIALDDSYGGAGGGIYALPNYGNATITDFSAVYSAPHPVPNVRLRLGQTLQVGTLAPFDTCQ